MTELADRAVASILESTDPVLGLNDFLSEYLQIEGGLSDLQALDALDGLRRSVTQTLDRGFAVDERNRVTSPFEWVDSGKMKLIRTGLAVTKPHAPATTQLISKRRQILASILTMTGRQFEFLCGVLLEIYGIRADDQHITQASSDGGIDFVALRRGASGSTHANRLRDMQYRVLGQANKVSGTVNTQKVTAFCQHTNDCRREMGRAFELLPGWFKTERHPIIGLFVTSGKLAENAKRAARENVIFALEGIQVAEDLAASNRSAGWFRGETLDSELFFRDIARIELGVSQ